MNALIELLTNRGWVILHKEISYKPTGPEGFVCADMDADQLKELTLEIEEGHGLGRLFDMDVIDRLVRPISRRDLGYEDRKCLLCEGTATVCRRESKHNLEKLLSYINFKIEEYFIQMRK